MIVQRHEPYLIRAGIARIHSNGRTAGGGWGINRNKILSIIPIDGHYLGPRSAGRHGRTERAWREAQTDVQRRRLGKSKSWDQLSGYSFRSNQAVGAQNGICFVLRAMEELENDIFSIKV